MLDHDSLDALAGGRDLATVVRDRAVRGGRWILDRDYGDAVARPAWATRRH